MFLVELIDSSFLDVISKQARLNAAVSEFFFLILYSTLEKLKIYRHM